MIWKLGLVALALAGLALVLAHKGVPRVWARTGSEGKPVLITADIDESQLIRVGGTRREANAKNDRGRVEDSFPMDHMLLQLKRAPELERKFDQYIDSLTDKRSPNFRHWMMAAEQGEKYGLAQQDIDSITGWLGSHGFSVGYVYPNLMVIDFSGTAGQIREAFHTEIHYLEVKGEQYFANMSTPQIPRALAPAVVGVVSMHNFKPQAMNKRADYTFSGCTPGRPTSPGTCYALVPADFQTIYNLNPLYPQGITGTGQTIVVVEDTDTYSNDVATYRSAFLGKYTGTVTPTHPTLSGGSACADPGTNVDDSEADLDAEIASAIAPNAAIQVAACPTGTTFGGLIAVQNLVNSSTPPAIISMSYGVCEAANYEPSNAAFNTAFQTGAAAGVSIFVSAGDAGASSCAPDFTGGGDYAYPGIGVTGWGETPYNVSVGGTDFEDVYNATKASPTIPISTYWNSTNTPTDGSAKSYIPEIPWNDSCASILISNYVSGSFTTSGSGGFCLNATGTADYLIAAGAGGGPSGCATGTANGSYLYIEGSTSCAGYAKPSWQSGVFGNPADGVRDIPDVSLFAANGIWGHFATICYSDTGTGRGGTSCAGAPSTWIGFGGTSVAAPMMAAIQALVNEKWGIRAGNPNPTYYSIAQSEFTSAEASNCYSINQPPRRGLASSCVFYDITQGDNDIACRYNGTTFRADCYRPSGTTNGVLGTQAISSLSVTAGGSGYTSTPTCSIAAPPNLAAYLSPTGSTIWGGGTQATCTVTINASTHVVSTISLTVGGQGYTGVPVCTISGGGGSGAKCLATITPTTGAAAYQPAFGATPGWDFATGIGSVNAYNLVFNSAW
jgi:hypothetical protein